MRNSLAERTRFVYDAATMRNAIVVVCIIWLAGLGAAAEPKQPPDKLILAAKAGNVTFDHAAHLAREKGACTFCHDRLWPQSAKAPVRSGVGCGSCHLKGGRAFAMKENCEKCHGKKAVEEAKKTERP